jgi:aerobic-type carbon monoxide dehydrogenase small subunit (CoxS/CutS family)
MHAWQRTRKNGTRGENTLGMCGWASTSWVSVDAANVHPCTMPATQQKRVRIYTGGGMGCSIAGSAEKAKASLEATI